MYYVVPHLAISIHAPSRERQTSNIKADTALKFQSTLPLGSDRFTHLSYTSLEAKISIHAPSRERRQAHYPHNADQHYFNPRSLSGATDSGYLVPIFVDISIHAPSRERHFDDGYYSRTTTFQSTLPLGSDQGLVF